MRPITGNDDDYWSYKDLIASMELDLLVKVDIGYCQGDSSCILSDGTRYGYLTFGWGSCSGCDRLAACSTAEQATEVRDQLYREIRWEPTAADLLAWIDTKDWALEWTYHEEEFNAFLLEAKAKLVRRVGQDGEA